MKFQISGYQIWKFKAPLGLQSLFAQVLSLFLKMSEGLILWRPSDLPWWSTLILFLFLYILLCGGLFGIDQLRMGSFQGSGASSLGILAFAFGLFALVLGQAWKWLRQQCLSISFADKFCFLRIIFGIVATIQPSSSTKNSKRRSIFLIAHHLLFTWNSCWFFKHFAILTSLIPLGTSGFSSQSVGAVSEHSRPVQSVFGFPISVLSVRHECGPFRVFMNMHILKS